MNHLFVGLITQALCQVPFKVALATLLDRNCIDYDVIIEQNIIFGIISHINAIVIEQLKGCTCS